MHTCVDLGQILQARSQDETAEAGSRHQIEMNLEAALAEYLAGSDIPAMAAAIVRPFGIECSTAVGARSVGEPKSIVTLAGPWHIGSATKAMTAAHYARLVDLRIAKWSATTPELFADLVDDIGYKYLLAAREDRRPLRDQRTACSQ